MNIRQTTSIDTEPGDRLLFSTFLGSSIDLMIGSDADMVAITLRVDPLVAAIVRHPALSAKVRDALGRSESDPVVSCKEEK